MVNPGVGREAGSTGEMRPRGPVRGARKRVIDAASVRPGDGLGVQKPERSDEGRCVSGTFDNT